MDKWKIYNPNPNKKRVGDCTVRALCKALKKEWDEIYAALTLHGFVDKDMPSANNVWGKYLKKNGFNRYLVDDKGKDVYTVEDFCHDHPSGTYVLALDGHVVCVENGYYYDSWDSGYEEPIYYWKRG